MDLDLACVDVEEFLKLLDIEPKPESTEVRFSCPYPAHSFGDKNPSAYMNIHTTAFICHSCGETGNAITFLADMKEVSRVTAKNWIAQKWAPHYAQIDDMRAFIEGMFEKQDLMAAPEPDPVYISEDEYEKRVVDWETDVSPAAMYMKNRGFDPFYLNLFDFCYDEISDRPCITVRDPGNFLVGFKGRAWRDEQWPKYMVLGDTDRSLAEQGERYGFRPYDAAKHVFGLHIADGDDLDQLIVCEGELNVISMYQKGFNNVVGPSGSTFSDKQVREIVSRCGEVVLLMDSDMSTPQSYSTALLKIYKAIAAFDKFVDVRVCKDHEGDPAEMTSEQLMRLINTSLGSTQWKVLQELA